jgi:hypothetical protein
VTTSNTSSLRNFFSKTIVSYTGQPTRNVTVKDSEFLPGENSYAQSPIGTHAYSYQNQLENIEFINNHVKNPIPIENLQQKHFNAPLHFPSVKNLKIEGNVFSSELSLPAWIRLENEFSMGNPNSEKTNKKTENVQVLKNKWEGNLNKNVILSILSNKTTKNTAFKNIVVENNLLYMNKSKESVNLVKVDGKKTQVEVKTKGNLVGTRKEIKRMQDVDKGKENLKDVMEDLPTEVEKSVRTLDLTFG